MPGRRTTGSGWVTYYGSSGGAAQRAVAIAVAIAVAARWRRGELDPPRAGIGGSD